MQETPLYTHARTSLDVQEKVVDVLGVAVAEGFPNGGKIERTDELVSLCQRVDRLLYPTRTFRLPEKDFSLLVKAAYLAQNYLGDEWLIEAAEITRRRGGKLYAYLHATLAGTLAGRRGQPVDTAEDRANAGAAFNAILKQLKPYKRQKR